VTLLPGCFVRATAFAQNSRPYGGLGRGIWTPSAELDAPHCQGVHGTGSTPDDFTVTTVDDPNLLPFFAYAVTTNTIGSSPAYHITHSVLKFNRNIVWNRSLNFNCTSTVCNADSRKVANHEFGHMEGLGHESSSVTSVMRQGALTFYQVQTDDRNGIIAIYGAYP
jgi:hypothetical protein